jgi:1-acyl-sn-glycerol-3-phosphate acyltransferase
MDTGRRAPGKTRLQALWWDVACLTAELIVRSLYLFRVEGAGRVPRQGPVLFVSNHESYLDPVVNAIAVKDRQMGFLAKQELFFGPFGGLIRSLGAIPLKERSDLAAIRAALAELQKGRCVIIYPEGGRSENGEVGPFLRGVALLIRRAGVPVVPMAVDGPNRAWPPRQRLPSIFRRLQVAVGDPIPGEVLNADEDGGLDRIRRAVIELQAGLRRRHA